MIVQAWLFPGLTLNKIYVFRKPERKNLPAVHTTDNRVKEFNSIFRCVWCVCLLLCFKISFGLRDARLRYSNFVSCLLSLLFSVKYFFIRLGRQSGSFDGRQLKQNRPTVTEEDFKIPKIRVETLRFLSWT